MTGGQRGGGAEGQVQHAGALHAPEQSAPLPRRPAAPMVCNRCGFAVLSQPWGCKNPCANCGTIYPLGDCSD